MKDNIPHKTIRSSLESIYLFTNIPGNIQKRINTKMNFHYGHVQALTKKVNGTPFWDDSKIRNLKLINFFLLKLKL